MEQEQVVPARAKNKEEQFVQQVADKPRLFGGVCCFMHFNAAFSFGISTQMGQAFKERKFLLQDFLR